MNCVNLAGFPSFSWLRLAQPGDICNIYKR